MEWWSAFLISFVAMEFIAWALHKYVMHGFLWWVHEDHHAPKKGYVFQKNDAFAFFFAAPSFFSILFGTLDKIDWLQGLGYGVMAYGAAYFFVHEIVIHRRWKFFDLNGRYFRAIKLAHQHHHQVRGKYGAENFGMLLAHPRYFLSEKPKRRVPSKIHAQDRT